MGNSRRGGWMRGQGLVEFALTLPAIAVVMMVSFDLGKMAVMQHHLRQAVYEGVKITSTVMTNGKLYCGDGALTLCSEMKDRAYAVLESYGIKKSDPGLKLEFVVRSEPELADGAADGSRVTFMVGLKAEYPYTLMMGGLFNFSVVVLKAEAFTRYVDGMLRGRALAASQRVSCDDAYGMIRYNGKNYRPVCV